ncbi:MAG: alcohol dehydrogenase catalytic domain-containing protein [Bryobacteraceae bacterium]|jgi:L-iditol 2-dehydrogenase
MIAELVGPRTFQVREAPLADPGPGEIQVAVKAVGICGSDLHNFSEGAIGDAPAVYPMVLGHEPVGTVLRCGAGVGGWERGDTVALEPAIYCYHCEFCRSGRHNVCANIRFLSSTADPGFFREAVNLPAANVLPLPGSVGVSEGTLHEPLAVVLHSMALAQPQLGETALVMGAGPIGLLTIAVLKLSGIRRLWVVEPLARRRELARAVGADVVLDPREADPVGVVMNHTGRRGVDMAIDCAAKDDSVNQCLHAARNAGRVIITGIPSPVRVPIEFHTLRRKELAFLSVRRSNHDSEAALRLLAEHPQRFAPIVTHTRPLAEIQSAFDMLESDGHEAGKVVLSV